MGIYGAGGFGKSALAAKVYGDATGFDEKLWGNFGQPKPFGTFALWLIAKAIGMERYARERELYEGNSDDDLLTRALNLWAGKRVLLVMDNVETLLAETMAESTGNLYRQFWEAWLNRNSSGMLLLTTQEKVKLTQAERREWLTLKGLEIAKGMALLQGEPFRIAGDEADLQAFVEAADGHPLLLRLAASWLVAKAKDDGETTEIYRLQRDDVTLLRHLSAAHRGDAEATVGKVLDASFDRLPEEWRLLLVRTSVLRGQVTVAAARGMVPEVTLPDLRKLARRSFWQEKRQGEDWVFEFLPLIRRYLWLKAGEMVQVEVAHQKATEYFQTAMVPWDGTLASCEAQFELFHHYCELGQFGVAYDVMNTCFGGLDRRGYYQELVTVYDRLTQEWEAQTPQEKENLGWAWTRLGNLYRDLGQYASAITHHEHAQNIFRTLDEKECIAASLMNLGIAYQSLGEYERAIDFHQQSLEIMREIGNRKEEANSLGNLGNVYQSLGEYQRAIDFHRQSLEIKRQIGDRNGAAVSLGNLGIAYQALGEYERAIDFHRQFLKIARQIGHRNGEANSLGNLGNVYQSLGEYQRAIDFYRQSLEIKRQIGDRNGEANFLGNLGNVYQSLGEYQRAIDFHRQSLEIKRQIGDRNGEAYFLGNLGNTYYLLGEYERASDFLEQSLEIARQIGDRNGEANFLGSLGNVYQSLGEYQRAIGFHRQFLEIARQISDRRGEAISFFNQGIVFAKLKNRPEALPSFQHAKQIFAELKLAHLVEKCETEISNLPRRKRFKLSLWLFFYLGLAIALLIWYLR